MEQQLQKVHNADIRRGIRSLILYLILLVAGCARSPDRGFGPYPGDVMADANQRYESGDFAGAAELYQELIANGVEDGTVYYNLGNAHFKSGDLGRAVLSYRRAQILLPRDPDVQANLRLARTQTRDRLERDGNGLAGFVTNVLVGWSTINETAAAALGLWITLCFCGMLLLVWQRQRGILRWLMVLLVIGLTLCVLSLGIRLGDTGRPPGVIVTPSEEVRSGPGTSYLVEFTLHSGAEVRVLEHRSAWARISLPGNLQGWVPDESVEEIK